MANINKLSWSFVDNVTTIYAEHMNGIVNTINNIIDALDENSGSGSSTPELEPEPTTYTITVTASPVDGGTVAGAGSYTSGQSATLTATAASGYTFQSWNDGNINATRTVTVSSNQAYTATFVAQQQTPSSVASPTMSLNAGKLTLACATADATIYYTLDDSTPTSSSTQYQSAITLTESCTIKAIAVKSGSSSSVTTKTYSRTSLHIGAWSDDYLISSTGQASNTSTNYPGVFSIGKNASTLPSDVTHLCYTRIILTAEDSDGYVAFYSGTSGTMGGSNCVGTPVALPKTASEHGTYDTASIEIPEGAERFRIPFWTSFKDSADIWYESLS